MAGKREWLVQWTYDGDELASESVAGDVVTFGYDPDGLVIRAGALSLHHGSDFLLDYTHLGTSTETFLVDEYGSLKTLLHQDVHPTTGSPRTLLTTTYTRDDAGRIIGITENVNGTEVNIGYGYDLSGRLDTVTYPDGIVRYTYDSNGNRKTREVVGASSTTVETASYDAQDRLLNYEGTQYTYTANGDLLTKTDATGTTSYVYDAFGNLLKVTLPSGTPIEYLIDGQNRRVGRKVNSVLTQRWLYSDQLRIIAELDGTGAVAKHFVYGSRSNVPDYMVAGGVTYRIYSDHLGSPRTVVDLSTGAAVQTLRFDEFGYVLTDTNPGFTPFGFAGGLYDAATTLVRFGARDYDAWAARWTTKDPILFDGGDTNLYGYVFSDPINLIDPTGLNPFCTIGGRFTPYVRTPSQFARAQQARGMPRATPPRPYVPKPVTQGPGGPGPVQATPKQNPSFMQRLMQGFGRRLAKSADDIADAVDDFSGSWLGQFLLPEPLPPADECDLCA